MINPLRLLPVIGGHLEKRDTSPWTSVVSTTLFLATEPTSVTLFGYYTTTPAVAGGTIVVSTKSYTTSTTASWATSPLTITSSPDAYCSTDYTARGNNVLNIQGSDNPTFQVGYTSACLPTGYATVDYYSPGICPSGYTLALKRDLATVVSNTKVAQTEGLCCFNSFDLEYNTVDKYFYCVTYFNPLPTTTGPAAVTSTAPITPWTVTAQYTTIVRSSSMYDTAIVSGSSIISALTTSVSSVTTYSHIYSVVSGGYGATVIAPYIDIRWQSTDKFVVDWAKSQSPPKNTSTATPTPPPSPPLTSPKPMVSGGAIGGIVIGAIAILGIFIGGLFFCLRQRKRRRQSVSQSNEGMAEHVYVQPKGYSPDTFRPPPMSPATDKSELDSRSLSPEQFSAYNRTSPSQGVHAQPAISPMVSELPVGSPSESIAGNTLNEGSRNLAERNDHRPPSHISSSVPETDMHGFLLAAPGPSLAAPQQPRSSWLEQQHRQVKEEKARLTRLQELSEMEARLEEQIERELADERRSELPL